MKFRLLKYLMVMSSLTFVNCLLDDVETADEQNENCAALDCSTNQLDTTDIVDSTQTQDSIIIDDNTICVNEFNPVCADGNPYTNSCEAEKDGYTQFISGACEQQLQCPEIQFEQVICEEGETKVSHFDDNGCIQGHSCQEGVVCPDPYIIPSEMLIDRTITPAGVEVDPIQETSPIIPDVELERRLVEDENGCFVYDWILPNEEACNVKPPKMQTSNLSIVRDLMVCQYVYDNNGCIVDDFCGVNQTLSEIKKRT